MIPPGWHPADLAASRSRVASTTNVRIDWLRRLSERLLQRCPLIGATHLARWRYGDVTHAVQSRSVTRAPLDGLSALIGLFVADRRRVRQAIGGAVYDGSAESA